MSVSCGNVTRRTMKNLAFNKYMAAFNFSGSKPIAQNLSNGIVKTGFCCCILVWTQQLKRKRKEVRFRTIVRALLDVSGVVRWHVRSVGTADEQTQGRHLIVIFGSWLSFGLVGVTDVQYCKKRRPRNIKLYTVSVEYCTYLRSTVKAVIFRIFLFVYV